MATFPTTPIPTNVSIKSVNQVYTSKFNNLNVEKRSNGAQRWEITLDYPVMNFTNGKSLFAFIMAHRGSLKTFDFSLPAPLNNTSGTHIGTFNIITGNSTGTSFSIGGMAVGATLKAGDMVQFSNHAKVYMITADITADGLGQGTLNVIPPVAVDLVPNTTTAQCNNVVMTAGFVNNTPEILIDNNSFYNLRSLKIEERFTVPVAVV